jgi:spore germination protein GerM
VILGTLALAFGVSCGTSREAGSSDAPGQGMATQAPSGTVRTTVYFLTDDGAAPIGTRRTIKMQSPYAREALNALLAGPTAKEEADGITTAIPQGTRLLSMTYRRHGADETVNLSELPQTLDPIEKVRIITQIARTVIGVSGIERIWLESSGQPWGMPLMDGGTYSGPWGHDELVGWNVGAGCPGTETVVCDHFAAFP